MSDRGHIHTLIANREQQLYGSLRDGMLSFQKYLTDTIEDICKNMMYDFKDIYLKIVFETHSENADTAVVKCKYCTSQSIEGNTEENFLEISKVYTVRKDVLDYFYSRILALETFKRDFAEKKLGAYKFDCMVSSDFISDMLYTYNITYILGGQKIKGDVR